MEYESLRELETQENLLYKPIKTIKKQLKKI